jgi:hypothetical protein
MNCTYCQQPLSKKLYSLSPVLNNSQLQHYICKNIECKFNKFTIISLKDNQLIAYSLYYLNYCLKGNQIINSTQIFKLNLSNESLNQIVTTKDLLIKTNYIPLCSENYASQGEALIPKLLKLTPFA